MSEDRGMDEMASSSLGFHFPQQYSLEMSGLACLTVGNIVDNESIQRSFSRALFVCEFNIVPEFDVQVLRLYGYL